VDGGEDMRAIARTIARGESAASQGKWRKMARGSENNVEVMVCGGAKKNEGTRGPQEVSDHARSAWVEVNDHRRDILMAIRNELIGFTRHVVNKHKNKWTLFQVTAKTVFVPLPVRNSLTVLEIEI
jgi:hypothetical protein